jgi:PAS domain S-box-containing protein
MKNRLTETSNSLSRRIFLYSLGISLFSVTILGIFWVHNKFIYYNREIKELKKTFSESKKLEIRNKILQIKDYIQWVGNTPLIPASYEIYSQFEKLDTFTDKTPASSNPKIFWKELKRGLEQSSIPIFVTDKKGRVIEFSANNLLGDKNNYLKILNTHKTPNRVWPIYSKMEGGDSALTAIYYKNTRLINGFNVISILNTKHLKNIFQKFILDSLSKLRFSDNDYVFISTVQGEALISNGKRNNPPVNILQSQNSLWKNVFKVELSTVKDPDGVFYTYLWPKLNDARWFQKTSYFSYLPQWEWIIGTGFYLDDINHIINDRRENLYHELFYGMLNVLIYLLIAVFLIYILVSFFTRKITENINLFNTFLENKSTDEAYIDTSKLSFKEFVYIARAVNNMIHKRQTAENELKKTEEKFAKAFKNSPDAIILSSINGTVLEANESFSCITGYSRDEIVGGSIIELNIWFKLHERNRYLDSIKRFQRATNQNADFQMKSGEIRNGLISGEVLEIENEHFLLSVIRDITDYKNMEKELLRLESRFRETLLNVQLITILLDIEGNITFCNDYLLKITGYSRMELLGNNWFDIFFPDSPLDLKKIFYGYLKKGIINPYQETKLLTKSGNYLYIKFSNTLLKDSDGKVIGATSIGEDITEQKHAEKALRESERHYRFLFEQNPMPMLIYELDTLNLLAVNDSFINNYGYSSAEILEMQLLDLYPDQEKEAMKDLVRNIKGLAYAGEWHHIKKDKSIINIEAHSHGLIFQGKKARISVINDLTERKSMEEALRVNENQLSAIYNTISDVLYYLSVEDSDTFRFISVNEMFLKTTGLKRQEIIDKTVFEVHLNPEIAIQNYKRAIELKQSVSWEEVTEISSEIVNCGLVKVTPLFDNNGICTNIVGSIHDITALRKTEKEIRNLNAVLEKRVEERTVQLESINKELESFTYSVSHDLRAPLRHINGYIELLFKRNKEQLNDKGIHYLQSIFEASSQMGVLIDDLLQFSRTGRMGVNKSLIDMNKALKDAFTILNTEMVNRVIDLEITELPKVNADFSLIRQVWVNLLSNALKYSKFKDVAHIEINFSEDLDNYIFYIKDNGSGFDMNFKHKLFGVFQRLHNNSEFEGTGIGLANVRQIIQKHNGKVWAEGEIDKGATFYFSIPKL